MRYLPELYYLQDHKNEEVYYQKALHVTTLYCASLSQNYVAEIISPIEDYSGVEIKKGTLPDNEAAITVYIQQLLSWLMDNSISDEHFYLMLSDKEINRNDGVQHIYDHHDDTCCWSLQLTNEQFVELQTKLESTALPSDLFYPEDASLTFEISDKAPFKMKMAGKVGIHKVFTPLQWQFEANKDWYRKVE